MPLKAAVIGGGASGMMTSVFLAQRGFDTCVIEKNEKAGKKLFITGKGRCNFTNACSREKFFDSIVTNSRFMYSSFAGFDNEDAVRFFENAGLPAKTERGGRVFPVSDRAGDVIDALKRMMKKYHVRLLLRTTAREILTEDGCVRGVRCTDAEGRESVLTADCVVIATGGLSYPSTGSTGDGYRFAEKAGLAVTRRRPSLVPLIASGDYPRVLEGLSLKNVSFTVRSGRKTLYSDFGEMMFTARGVTGPLALSASAVCSEPLEKGKLTAEIDFKPAISEETFDLRLLREFGKGENKDIQNALTGVYPARLTSVILDEAEIDPHRKVHTVLKKEREEIVRATKHFPLTLTGTEGWEQAVITQGGIDVSEINPRTMRVRKVKGLYAVGEVLDIDALTGGYNLQIAWSTAHACGTGALTEEEK